MTNISKKVALWLSTLAVTSAIFIACNENKEMKESDTFGYKTTLITPSNSANPYDTIGSRHNTLLYRLLSARATYEQQNSYSFTGRYNELLSFYSETATRFGEYVPSWTSGLVNDMLTATEDRNCFFSYIDRQNLSTQTKSVVKNIILHSVSMSINNPRIPYGNYHRYIVSVEDSILTGSINIPAQEIKSVLAFTSIFRHSMQFWLTYDGEFDRYNPNTPGPQYSFWGLLLGDAIGGLVGSLLGPNGTVIGATLVSGLVAEKDVENGDAQVEIETDDEGHTTISISYGDGNGDNNSNNQ